MEDFKKDDEIIILSCDPKHFFHADCINKQYKDVSNPGWNKCPLCQAEIVGE
jgi:hypothetical protein